MVWQKAIEKKSDIADAVEAAPSRTTTQKILDAVERIGNSVPHPVVIFLILIAIAMALSHILYLIGASVSYQVVNPDTDKVGFENQPFACPTAG